MFLKLTTVCVVTFLLYHGYFCKANTFCRKVRTLFVEIMDILSKFSDRLKELMFENDLTVEKLSNAIDCSPSSIYEWRSGRMSYMPSVGNILMLADYFKCSIDFLIGLEHENYLPNPRPRPPFSQWFRTAVESKGQNLNSLGCATKMGTKQFYKWINGETQPNLDSLLRIAAVLKCSLDYLVGREK